MRWFLLLDSIPKHLTRICYTKTKQLQINLNYKHANKKDLLCPIFINHYVIAFNQ